ncbi:MAG: DNA cytosine methyltransferase, partial [Spirochaetota bacterium]
MVKVIDIFAGPGGLSEGFASVNDNSNNQAFEISLSIEMDPYAFKTLKLRSFFRQFPEGAPLEYYKHLKQEITLEKLYESYKNIVSEVEKKCWNTRLGQNGT